MCVCTQTGVQVCGVKKGGTFWLVGHNGNSTFGRRQWMHIAMLLLGLLTSPSAANPTLCLSPADRNTGDQAVCHCSRQSLYVWIYATVWWLWGSVDLNSTAEHVCQIIWVNCAIITTKCPNRFKHSNTNGGRFKLHNFSPVVAFG